MVWIIHAARDSVSRFLVVFFLMYLIPSLGLYHCIIGACEALFLVFRGQAGLGEALGGFFLPVLLGNTIGGVLLVGILNYAQTRDNRFPDRDCGQLELTWREWLFEIHTGTPGEEPLTPRGEPKGTEDRLNNPANAADHSLGPDDADLTLVQYGDYECPTSQRIYETVMDVTADLTVRYVYRHLPLSQRHQHAHMAARAAEAAAAQGQFWKMHDLLFTYQNHLEEADLRGYAEQLGLDMAQFERDMNADAAHQRITDDRESAIDNGVRTTANLFINGARHQGEYTREALREVITRRHDRFQRLAPEAL
jgi:protein-disulfide isomerase